MAANAIDPARVRELFSYDRHTGELRWAKPQSRRMKVGDVAGGLKSDDPLYRYWVIRMDGRRYRRARLVWAFVQGEDPQDELDHADRDKTNDRVENLRLATRSQNGVNTVHPKLVHHNLPRGVRPKRRHGQVVGYRGRYEVQGRRIDVGPYSTPERAGEAVRQAIAAAHGGQWLPD